MSKKHAKKQSGSSRSRSIVKVIKVATTGLPKATYEVRIGGTTAHGLIHGCFEGLIGKGRRVLVVVDSNLPRGVIEPLIRSLDKAGITWAAKVVTATEADKSLSNLEATLVEAARLRLERGDLMIALGGGIVTDLAGFAAAVYRRGVRIVQCPSTLLAMVDAAVGGKTAANLAVTGIDDHDSHSRPSLLKNAVGVFHQPTRVICDVSTLDTLPPRELRCGLAECIKHGLLGSSQGDPSLLRFIEQSAPRFMALDHASLSELVSRNVALKARVVKADPREESTAVNGGRMMLNLGHTFAHAFETLPGGGHGGAGLAWRDQSTGAQMVGPLKHGEAVGLGLLCAAHVSASLKLCEKGLPDRIRALLTLCGLPTRIEGLSAASVVQRMAHDKKVAAGRMRLVLPVKSGGVRIHSDVPAGVILKAIDALVERR